MTSPSPSATTKADAFPDGTTDYKPLRSRTKFDPSKVHIADTPMTWSNWPRHVNWLNTTLIIFIPLLGFVSAYWVPLQLYTAIFAIVFYFNAGLGITAGESMPRSCLLLLSAGLPRLMQFSRRLSPSLGPYFLQGHASPQDLPGRCWCRRR